VALLVSAFPLVSGGPPALASGDTTTGAVAQGTTVPADACIGLSPPAGALVTGRSLRLWVDPPPVPDGRAAVWTVDNDCTDARTAIGEDWADVLLHAGPERSAQPNCAARAYPAASVGFIDTDMVVSLTVVEEAAGAIGHGAGSVIVSDATRAASSSCGLAGRRDATPLESAGTSPSGASARCERSPTDPGSSIRRSF
jgi:hypothetical protein